MNPNTFIENVLEVEILRRWETTIINTKIFGHVHKHFFTPSKEDILFLIIIGKKKTILPVATNKDFVNKFFKMTCHKIYHYHKVHVDLQQLR